MKKIRVNKNAYYQEKYENNGHIITNGPTTGYLIWKNKDEVLKTANTLQEAKEFTDQL